MRALPTPPPSTPLAALAEEIYLAHARWDPAWATNQGLHRWDGTLADPTAEARRTEVAEIDAFLARLSAVPVRTGEEIDAAALQHTLETRRFHLVRLARWRRNPDFALEVLDHIFPLLARPFAPLGARLASAAERLAAAPGYLGAARGRIAPAEVPPLWVKVALESVEAAPALLDAAVEAGVQAHLPAEAMSRLAGATEEARAALESHGRWLKNELAPRARGNWAVGEGAFDELLAVRGVPARGRDLIDLGERLVAEHQAALADAGRTVLAAHGEEDLDREVVARAFATVRADHPADFAGVLAAYRRACDDARAFCRKHDLLALAPGERIEIVETPSYLRHLIPFAAYMQPGRFDPEPVGIYLVTPKVDLSAFAHADIRNVTAHEAYPGHHAQLTLANRNPSLARGLADAVETIEGWALYCEEVMGRHGFTSDPKERFIRTRDALFRAARVRLDPALHLGELGFDEAVVSLRDTVGMSSEEAEAEVKRYTLEPGYNFSYMWGKMRILELRRAWESRGGTERGFHDALTGAGSLPMAVLERCLTRMTAL